MSAHQRHIRRHGPVYLVGSAPSLLIPQLRPMESLISEAAEGEGGNNPNDIGEGVATGRAIRLDLLGTGSAMANPSEGIGWSIPMRDSLGQAIAEISDRPQAGWVRLGVLENPSELATPSNACVFVGWTADGPIGTATRALVFALKNTTAGAWRVTSWYRNGGSWTEQEATGDDPVTTGVHGSWGTSGNLDQQLFGYTALALPSPSATLNRLLGLTLTASGNDPHFVFGGGWAGTPAGDASLMFEAFGFFGQDPDAILAGM